MRYCAGPATTISSLVLGLVCKTTVHHCVHAAASTRITELLIVLINFEVAYQCQPTCIWAYFRGSMHLWSNEA